MPPSPAPSSSTSPSQGIEINVARRLETIRSVPTISARLPSEPKSLAPLPGKAGKAHGERREPGRSAQGTFQTKIAQEEVDLAGSESLPGWRGQAPGSREEKGELLRLLTCDGGGSHEKEMSDHELPVSVPSLAEALTLLEGKGGCALSGGGEEGWKGWGAGGDRLRKPRTAGFRTFTSAHEWSEFEARR